MLRQWIQGEASHRHGNRTCELPQESLLLLLLLLGLFLVLLGIHSDAILEPFAWLVHVNEREDKCILTSIPLYILHPSKVPTVASVGVVYPCAVHYIIPAPMSERVFG